ncbi:MAG: hypothetical protein HKP05_11330 [Woeseiaceae bacterium]|nr:hypothetical protein [Gammaproteobacteria bacterium]NNK26230.1 hypothetical protein [Woeseiaceae bacterium]
MIREILALLVLLGLAACAAEDVHETLKIDLGTVAAEGRVVPVDGVTSAGQPDEAAFRVFANSGYTTVIDLRMPGENRGLDEPAVVESLGMSYVPLPTSGDLITFDQARRLDELIDAADGPVLVHCGSANRVGALVALSEYAEGGDMELALEKGRKAGLTRLEGVVKKAIEAE